MAYNITRYNRHHTHDSAVPPWDDQSSPTNNVNDMMSRELDVKKARYTQTAAFFWAEGGLSSPADLFLPGDLGDYWIFDADNTYSAPGVPAQVGDNVAVATGLLNGTELTPMGTIEEAPVFYVDTVGVPHIRFDGQPNQALSQASFAIESTSASWAVGGAIPMPSGEAGEVVAFNGTSNGAFDFRIPSVSGGAKASARATGTSFSRVANSDTSLGDREKFSAVGAATLTDLTVPSLYFDETYLQGTNLLGAETFTTRPFRVGARNASAALYTGDVYWCFAINRELTLEEQVALAAWGDKLMKKL